MMQALHATWRRRSLAGSCADLESTEYFPKAYIVPDCDSNGGAGLS